MKSLRDNADAGILIFLVGNKVDLKEKRQIRTDEGAQKAAGLGVQFAEVSAKTGFGVGDLFASVSQIVLENEAAKTEKIPRNTGVAVGETSAVGGCCS
jgi:Ras-related protein Rab-5C